MKELHDELDVIEASNTLEAQCVLVKRKISKLISKNPRHYTTEYVIKSWEFRLYRI